MPLGCVAVGRLALSVLLLLGAVSLAFAAQDNASESPTIELPQRDDVTVLETLVVSGMVPGPGLWKVRSGNHTMWILGSLQPVSRRMQWESAEVERVVASAGKVLLPPSVKFDVGMGRLRQLMLVPALMGARKSEDGGTLAEHVDSADYARWLVLKKAYLGRNRGVEKRRPLFAAQELYEAALKKSGLHIKAIVTPLIRKVAKKHAIPVERPQIEIMIANPREAIRNFRGSAIDDAECFRKTLDHLEADLEKMRIRANAWAHGDMLTLREITYENQSRACMDAVLESRFAQEQGVSDLPERLETLWLEAAEAMLAQHEISFAVLPISRLVADDGLLATLAARGYQIEAP